MIARAGWLDRQGKTMRTVLEKGTACWSHPVGFDELSDRACDVSHEDPQLTPGARSGFRLR